MTMIHSNRIGTGEKLLLVHGLGGSWQSWSPMIAALAAHREIIAIDLPGHGQSLAQPGSGTFRGLSDSLEHYIAENGLGGVDVAGFSLGGRLVLEMARRGCVGNVVALSPGGFWAGWERSYFKWTLRTSLGLLRLLDRQLPALSASPITRTMLLAQLSARPWALPAELVQRELVAFAGTRSVGPLIADLAEGRPQQGPAAASTGKITIVWGRKDHLCLPRQAARAAAAFPTARIEWFENSGHYSIWDFPERAAEVIINAGSRTAVRGNEQA